MLRLLLLCASAFAQDPAHLLSGKAEFRETSLRTSTVFKGQPGVSNFNLHSYIAHHDGLFWAMWSSGRSTEDSANQHVIYATSKDGHTWSEPRALAADPDGPDGPQRWIARGIYVIDGKLTALAALIESADYGKRGREEVWRKLRLMRFEWASGAWRERGVFAENCMNNFPPERLNGALAMVCRDSNMNVSMAIDDGAGWRHTPIASAPPFDKMDEPTFYATRAGEVHMIVRDNTRSGVLLRAISKDHGRTWTAPVRTDYPDATSKNFPGRLSNGWFYLISNPNPKTRNPLGISFSRDGWTFGGGIAVAAPNGASVQYPHAIEHNGSLWIVYSTNKQSIEVTELPLAKMNLVDVAVYGGTPGGVAAAIAAARAGRTVALLEYHKHIGGMTTSGLGKSDIETKEAIGGLFREFTSRVKAHYVERYGPSHDNVKKSRDGYYYEPSVAQRIIDRMVADEKAIAVRTNVALDGVTMDGARVTGVRVKDRSTGEVNALHAAVVIDGTYEGDVFAAAGARYRVGREGRSEFNEKHAGVIYQNYDTREVTAGSTGGGDKRIPAYTYRLCMTADASNAAVLTAPPPNYDRTRYLGYIDDWKAGRLDAPKTMKDGVGYYSPTFGTLLRALSFAELPNGKFDVNMNPRPLGFPFAELNYKYPDAGANEREKIAAEIRNITLGLIYFLQNDEAVPLAHRQLARRYQLAKDEFTDSDNFPFQLYVREARRLEGLYTLSETDTVLQPGRGRTPIFEDAIAAGEFPVDSFPVRGRESSSQPALEGYVFMLDHETRPYQIPYRVMIPRNVDGLIVPVAASTTHIAFSTVRVEPTWMALGMAAGMAAHLAIERSRSPRAVNTAELQKALLEKKQVITYFKDIDQTDPAFAAMQYFGARGFFENYAARSRDLATPEEAKRWWRLAKQAGEPPSNITRGDLCRLLYRIEHGQ